MVGRVAVGGHGLHVAPAVGPTELVVPGLPGVQVQARQAGVRGHARSARRQRRRRLHQPDRAAQHPRNVARQVALVLGLHQAADLDPQRVAQAGRVARERRLDAQRERRRRGLAQRLGGVDRHPDQVAGETELRVSGDEPEGELVGGLAAQAAGQARHRSEFARLAQAVGAGRALAGEAQARIGLGAAFEAGVAAEHLGGRADDREALAAEVDPPARTAEQRAVGRQAQVVAGQADAALDLAFGQVVKRQVEAECQVCRAGAAGLREGAAGPAAHRRRIDEAQHFVERSAAAAIETEHAALPKVGDAAIDARPVDPAEPRAGVLDQQARAVDDQLALAAGQRRPGRDEPGLVACGRHAGHVSEFQALEAGRDAELAVLRVACGLERKLPEIAANPEVERAHAAGAHRALDILARTRRQAQRQIARHARRHALAQPAFELEPARIAPAAGDAGAGAGFPAGIELALRVAVGEARVLHLHADLRRVVGSRAGIDLPAQVGGEALERHHRLLEYAGQVDRAVGHGQARMAAALGRVELQVRIAQPGPADAARLVGRARAQRQPAQPRLDLVVGRRVERPVPAQREVVHHALRRELRQQAPHRVAQRNPGRDGGHQAEIDALGAEAAAAGRLAAALLPAQVHVAGRPAHAVAGAKAEPAHADRAAGRIVLRHDAALDLLEAERLDVACQPQRHRAQRQVDGGAVRFAVADLDPGAQRAVAFGQLERQLDMPAQLAHVGARQVGVDLAAPAPPVAGARQQRLRHARHQTEAITPGRVGGRRQAQLMAAQAVAHHQFDLAQRQRRRLAQLVGPAQGRAANHPLALLEEPVAGRSVVGPGGAEVEPRDVDATLRIAPRLELGAVDIELREAQFEGQQRARRERGDDARQGQCRTLLRVVNDDVAQLDAGHPPARSNLERADRHGRAQGPARRGLDAGAPLVDVRQNPPMQDQPRQQHQAPGADHQQEQAAGPDPQRTADPSRQGGPPARCVDHGRGH